MRILKSILKWIGIVLLVIIIVSFFLPSVVHVERATVINASPEIVFDKINNLRRWQEWSPWMKMDTAIVITYEGPEAGVGAKYSWVSKEMGNGNLTISTSIASDSLRSTMDFGGMGISYGSFKLSKEENATKVVWSFDTKGEGMSIWWKVPSKYFHLFMDKMIGKDFEKGLNDLKTLSEKEAAMPKATSNFTIEATTGIPRKK